jgi:hypothetical protein
MARWKTQDVARFVHNDDPKTTIIGEVECLLCSWKIQPTSPYIFPTVDDVVQKHMEEAHADALNEAGVQRTPDGDALIYYVILNPES